MKNYNEDGEVETQGEKEQKEYTKEFNMDWKTFAIGSLVFALVLCFVGYNLRDTGLQNSLETITNEKQNIRKQEMIIVKAQESISGSTAKIEGAKEVLKNSYKLIVQ